MNGVDAVVGAFMYDAMDFFGPRENAARAIPHHRIIFPAPLPEFVHDLHILAGDFVTSVMGGLPVQADALGSAVQIAGDDIPSHAPLRKMIECRHPPCKRI